MRKGKAKRKAAKKRRAPRGNAIMAKRIQDYAELLTDPCGGKLVTGSYPGEVGIVSRYVSDVTNAAGNCGWAAYYPSVNAVSSANPATPATASLHSWTVGAPFSPGHSLLTGSASKSRCLAACLEVMMPNVSITNITGEICAGCVSADTLASGFSYSVDQLFTLLPQKAIIQRTGFGAKFTPGLFDSRFTTYGTLASADQSDTNILIIAWRGLPGTTQPSYRITSVLEWTPKASSGLVASSSEIAAGVDHLAVAAAVHQRAPNWWHNLKHELESDASTAFRYVAKGAMGAVSSVAANYISRGVAALMI